ncbi:hypothetical protein Taro_031789 [Colocasia esculenta]|uniref:Uncharacterized protein n=1 Tax=Colocasia esculenta TaxID=4460 RepID=A0A843VJP3_COLES|nr:hypothetical protein [Colocasia esculenta]
MVYTYTPAYYSSLHDTITSLCKTILPFSFKNRRLTSQPEQKLAKRQSDNLKWQQESFHRILNLVGLQREGIASDREVSTFRSHLLDTLVASPADPEPPGLIRDKLLFLQELFYAKCISSEEYHSSKRPLLQRLAVQGVEVDCRDVVMGSSQTITEEEEWSVIELTEKESPAAKENKPKHLSSIKGAMSLIGIASGKGKSKKPAPGSTQEPFAPVDLNRPPNAEAYNSFGAKPSWGDHRGTENRSILMPESSHNAPVKEEEKVKKKSFRTLFQKEQTAEGSGKKEPASGEGKRTPKSSRTAWGFDGIRKWKRSTWEDEDTTPYLPPGERSDDATSLPCALVTSPVGEGPDTKRIKKKMHPDGAASDFFIDKKVLGENIKKELSRIQSELNTKNPNLSFSDDQIEAISTRLPVDKADLKKFFPKTWCDRYGEIVLDVVRKEFKDHVGEMETLRNAAKERRESSEKWVAFDEDDGDFHTNLFFRDQTFLNEAARKGGDGCFANNPPVFHDVQNAFWASSSGNSR